MISITMDSRGVTANLLKLDNNLPYASSDSVEDVANEVMRLSQEQVPHDKGTLQDSGTVEKVGNAWVVGYHTPYAARLHEHPEYHFQRGRKGKYLEDPIRDNAAILGLKAGNSFSRRWLG